jgi:acetoin utilization deacetylase AcuC-like enzyme
VDVFYCDHFVLPLPVGHRFPMEKYRLLRAAVAQTLPGVRLLEPPAADNETLALAHAPDYIERLVCGDLSRQEMQRIGFPWSLEMVARARRSVGATVEACRSALRDGAAVNLAGGTHHAFFDRGEGFCCFNDAAVAARAMRCLGLADRVAIVDLDVHQGNGTAEILRNDSEIISLSLHGSSNYPFVKAESDIDIALEDGTGDDDYLAALGRALALLAQQSRPDLLIYLAGADPYEDDRLGRLGLTKQGLLARDEMVFGFAAERGLPVAVAMAGGYARQISDTVAIHLQTVDCALQHYRRSHQLSSN